MDVGTRRSDEMYTSRDSWIRCIRPHSMFRAALEAMNPGVYEQQYEGKPGADYFKDTQLQALGDTDVVFFPTYL